MSSRWTRMFVLSALVLCVAACSGSASEKDGRPGGGRGHAGGPGMPGGGTRPAAAVPVEVAPVLRRNISFYIETNGTLEAENEVDVVARVAGPIVQLSVEEGDRVTAGQVLARLDESEYLADLEIARVNVNETELAYQRALNLSQSDLISVEEFERARADHDSARAQLEASQLLLSFTKIRAPFDGLIVNRYVDNAQQVSVNTALFRISDFEPLLCPIQVPERELSRLRVGQSAYLTVEAYPERRFGAKLLRIRPVVDADTGTVRVTLEVETRGLLRPGMFARAFLETETHAGALVLPKTALSMESIGDTIYVADGSVARRREVQLGFSEGDFVEIVSGVEESEQVVVVGQDGLSEGTPIQVLDGGGEPVTAQTPGGERRAASGAGGPDAPRGPGGPGRGGPPGGRRIDPSNMTPEQLERAKEFMRSRGMSEEQIEERLRRARERSGTGDD